MANTNFGFMCMWFQYEQSPPIDIVGQNHNNRDDEDKDKERERERESYLRQLLLVSSSSARPSSSTSSPRASRRRKSPHRQHQNQDQSQLLANHTKYQFYLGPPLSGAPFHSHGPAFNGLVHGQKLWFLLPPGNDIYTAMHPLRWLLQKEYIRGLYRNNRDSSGADTNTNTLLLKGPCVLLQNPDEVIYIPRHWSHQVSALELFIIAIQIWFLVAGAKFRRINRLCSGNIRLYLTIPIRRQNDLQLFDFSYCYKNNIIFSIKTIHISATKYTELTKALPRPCRDLNNVFI